MVEEREDDRVNTSKRLVRSFTNTWVEKEKEVKNYRIKVSMVIKNHYIVVYDVQFTAVSPFSPQNNLVGVIAIYCLEKINLPGPLLRLYKGLHGAAQWTFRRPKNQLVV